MNSVIIGLNVTIHGNVSITGATGQVFLDHVTIGGNLKISDSNVSVIAVASQVTGNALFQNNTTNNGSFGIVDTVIFGNLVCNGNNPVPELVEPITVSGRTIGQCKLP